MSRKISELILNELRIPVLQSVLAPVILEAAEAESLFGGRKQSRIKLL